MAVAVLMYHGTPVGEPAGMFDVPLKIFKAQINYLVNSGVSFIPFSSSHDKKLLSQGMHVALTFDDGHGGNIHAIEFLHSKGIRPSQFIVADWSRTGIGFEGQGGYMRATDIRALTKICDFGAHGKTHVGLAGRSAEHLECELTDARDYVEQTTGMATTTMSFPGGAFDAAAISTARILGYDLLGNSVFDVNIAPGETVNRIVIGAESDAKTPLRLVQRPLLLWQARNRVRKLLRR